MSEQLKQQGKNAYINIGEYTVYIDVGATTLNQLQELGIIPSVDLKGNGSRKPDRIILKKNAKKNNIFTIGENKDIKKFDNEEKRLEALNQAIEVAQLFKSPSVPIVYCTDGTYYVYAVLKGTGKKKEYKIVTTEDNYLFTDPLFFEHGNLELNEDSISILESILSKTNEEGKFIVDKEVNPSNLATRVWQKTWIAKKCKPEQALSLFIEIFVLKYLSDLGIFGNHITINGGHIISFEEVLTRGKQHALQYYFNTVRPYIKTTFPTNIETEYFYPTTIINGLPLNQNDSNDAETFYGILKEFNDFGKLTNISKDFKTRLFEDFLKGTQIIADRGQYFTPRKVVQAIVDMADLPSYKGESLSICDPACGVGGFIFEAMNRIKNKIDLQKIDNNNLIKIHGYDINEDENHAITGVLGKANCLIYLSDKIALKPKLVSSLSKFMNKTLFSYKNTKLGSLSEIKKEEYDLILTNPPYVVNGSGDVKESLRKLNLGYQFYGTGLEGIFTEKIIYELKEQGRGFLVLPDGIFNRSNDKKLRDFIFNNCYIEGIIGLPLKTFFNTPKKTYILIVKKMKLKDKLNIKNRKTFIYESQSIGETLDKNRFDDFENNDLKFASKQFKKFISIINSEMINEELKEFDAISNCKIIDENDLFSRENWIFEISSEEEENSLDELLKNNIDILNKIQEDIGILIKEIKI